MRNRAATFVSTRTVLLTRTILLTVGAFASFGVMVWAASQAAPSSVQAGPQAAIADSNDGDSGESDDPTVLDDDGRFTGPGEVWPPQPKYATDIVQRPDLGPPVAAEDTTLQRLDQAAAEQLAASDVLESASDVVESDSAVAEALGERYNLIAVDEQADGITRLVYYSLSNNQTVDVTMAAGSVTNLELVVPDVFQPELSEAEKLAAVEVARSHWEDRRDRRIDSLQGYSILTFRPGGAYYDTRMVYVSFHVDEDSRPELLAWVDLAAGDVVRSEVDR